MMKLISQLPGFVLHQIRALFYGSKGELLPEGTPAPGFVLPDESGKEHRLSNYRGSRIVLWWCLRASTPG